MCEGRGVTRPPPTEIPYLLAFFPSLRAASDRTLSVSFPIRPQTYDGRFYDMELKRIVDRHWHKLSDDDREVVDRELPRIKAQLAAVRPVECPCMAAFADESKGVLRLIRLPEETEDRLEVDPPLLAPLELMLRKHPPSLIVIAHKEQAQTFASILDEVIPQHHIEGASVQHIKSGGNKNPSLQRREENRVKSNMAAVVRLIEREVSAGSCDRPRLARAEAERAQLNEQLPPSLKLIRAGRLSGPRDRSDGGREV